MKALTLVLFAAGVGASFAIAGPPPGKGNPHKAVPAADSTTAATGTTTTTESHPAKVTLCHLTGSKKHPYVLLKVAAPAQKAHLRHGDVAADASRTCPATAPAGAKPKHGDEGDDDGETTGTTTTTASTTTTTAKP